MCLRREHCRRCRDRAHHSGHCEEHGDEAPDRSATRFERKQEGRFRRETLVSLCSFAGQGGCRWQPRRGAPRDDSFLVCVAQSVRPEPRASEAVEGEQRCSCFDCPQPGLSTNGGRFMLRPCRVGTQHERCGVHASLPTRYVAACPELAGVPSGREPATCAAGAAFALPPNMSKTSA